VKFTTVFINEKQRERERDKREKAMYVNILAFKNKKEEKSYMMIKRNLFFLLL